MLRLDMGDAPIVAAYFRLDHGTFTPLANAGSGWADDQIRGPAVSGLLARAVEREASRLGLYESGMRPVRWTLDLFRAAPMRAYTAPVTIARRGRRVCVLDTALIQGGTTFARASALFFAGSDDPTGAVWSRTEPIDVPDQRLEPVDIDQRLMFSPATGWTADLLEVGHAKARRQSWHRAVSVIEGEQPSPFEVLASAADFANVIINWGERGLQFINADLTLTVARLPRMGEVGIRSQLRVEANGVAVGAAELFDREGVLGIASLSAISNVRRAVDPRTRAPMSGGDPHNDPIATERNR